MVEQLVMQRTLILNNRQNLKLLHQWLLQRRLNNLLHSHHHNKCWLGNNFLISMHCLMLRVNLHRYYFNFYINFNSIRPNNSSIIVNHLNNKLLKLIQFFWKLNLLMEIVKILQSNKSIIPIFKYSMIYLLDGVPLLIGEYHRSVLDWVMVKQQLFPIKIHCLNILNQLLPL